MAWGEKRSVTSHEYPKVGKLRLRRGRRWMSRCITPMSHLPPSPSSSRPRLIDRLEALIASTPNSSTPRSTPNQSPRDSLDSPSDMRRPPSIPLPSPTSNRTPPVLRWLSNWSPSRQHSRSGSESGSHSSSPSNSSPDLTLLREALQEPLITPLPVARLPPSFRARNLARPPPFLDNLTRSTLPTSSLSPPLQVATSSTDVPLSEIQLPPIILNHSPPRR